MSNVKEIIKNCKELISSNQLLEVFNILIAFTEKNKLNQENDILIIRKGEFNSIKNEIDKGTIDFKQSEVLNKRIRSSLISIINRIEYNLPPEKAEKPELIKSEQINNIALNNEITTVFISYSWDNETHKKWVLELAYKLTKDGINVILDRWELRLGKNIFHFMENSIKKADRAIIIFTPNYKLKAENRAGGVGYEYSIMNATLYKDQINNKKIIPVLRDGKSEDSIPEFMQQYIHLDMRDDNNFNSSYIDLLREIYDEPENGKPNIGPKIKFD